MANHGRVQTAEDEILELVAQFTSSSLVRTKYPGHGLELARNAVEQGCDLLIAVGGDGTVHEIVNGLVVDDKVETTLGIVPIGSGNDLAFGLGLTKNIQEAVKTIFSGQRRVIDLARVTDNRERTEIAINAIGIGFDATINIQSRTISRIHGFPMYAIATLRTIALYFQTPRLTLRFDDESIEQRSLMLAIGLGRRVGGGFYLTPDAVHDDNLLDSCTVNPVGRLTMLAMLPRVMRGTHVTSKHVTMRRSHVVEVQSDIPLPVHIDGEVFAVHDDNVRQLTVTSIPSALPIMNPG
jgi:YegS/Rv2252/BmrU family lipid kinase